MKGDVERPENYRPILTLPTLYEVFSTPLYNRLYNKHDRRPPPDQGGFRHSLQPLDHLATYRLLERKCREWGAKMWIATVDFAKAFDTIRHDALWKALARFGIDTPYISLLKKLYAEQQATVLTDKESGVFEIQRGTKQGDGQTRRSHSGHGKQLQLINKAGKPCEPHTWHARETSSPR